MQGKWKDFFETKELLPEEYCVEDDSFEEEETEQA